DVFYSRYSIAYTDKTKRCGRIGDAKKDFDIIKPYNGIWPEQTNYFHVDLRSPVSFMYRGSQQLEDRVDAKIISSDSYRLSDFPSIVALPGKAGLLIIVLNFDAADAVRINPGQQSEFSGFFFSEKYEACQPGYSYQEK
ncbi:MAG: hypothetical protein DRQ44_13900, partial [Gammaproteobacteria bacterium]